MLRADYFNFIEEKLSILVARLKLRGGLNILDLNLHSENFYADFFNLMFHWNLLNINSDRANIAGIDLVDHSKKIVVQVSATATKQKIQSALAQDLTNYGYYRFIFISIHTDTSNLRSHTFLNPSTLSFSPTEDIFDVTILLNQIRTMGMSDQENIYNFFKKEFKDDMTYERVESNLATIIQFVSNEDWATDQSMLETIPFDIEEKISYNQLNKARFLIDDYKIHHTRIDKIYTAFDVQGVNKSLSVLNTIRTEYHTISSAESADNIFFKTIDNIILKIIRSSNYVVLPEEELRLCVQILVVDAFVRCKIFENPLRKNNANS